MKAFLFDTTVFVYAAGRPHAYREPCRAIVERARADVRLGAASVGVLHELAHITLRRTGDRELARTRTRQAAAICTEVYDCERRDLDAALDLLVSHDRLDVADAVTAATALNRGVAAILSADRDFDGIPGLERIDPADESAVEALLR